jgi:drug/metabolite transporter (DMT)-like permease
MMTRNMSSQDAHQQLHLVAVNRRGIIAMSLSMALFVANDALVKHVSSSLPSGQLIFIRGLFATALMLSLAQAVGALRQWPLMANRTLWVRSGFDACASMVYLTAVFHLPLGNATAINLASPLFIILLAMWWLREHVTLIRGLAVVIGFTGVLLVVQPAAEGFSLYSLVAVLGTLLHATRDLLTRRIPPQVPAALISLSTALSVTLLSGTVSLFQDWQPVPMAALLQLALAAVFLSAGYYTLIMAMRTGDVSVIAPFRYSGLLFALLIGHVLWDEMPNALAWGGIALLVGSGLTILHTERRRQQAALQAQASLAAETTRIAPTPPVP